MVMGLGEEDYRDEMLLSPQPIRRPRHGHNFPLVTLILIIRLRLCLPFLHRRAPLLLSCLHCALGSLTKCSSRSTGRVLSSTSLRGECLHELTGVICVGDLTPPLFIHSLDQPFLCISMDSFTDIYFTLCIKIL